MFRKILSDTKPYIPKGLADELSARGSFRLDSAVAELVLSFLPCIVELELSEEFAWRKLIIVI